MKLNKRWLRSLSNIKGMGKIKEYEVVAGGVILHFNNGSSVITKNRAELETEIAQVLYEEE